MSKVAKLMNIDRMTVVRLLDAWQGAEADKRFSVLYREEGQGAKLKLEPVRDKIPELLEKNNRSSRLVLDELEKEYGITVCKITLQNFLKGAGL
jgi:transposase